MTLVDLAKHTGLSHSFLSQVERGRARPSMASLHRIAVALRTSQSELMAGSGPLTGAGQTCPAVRVIRAGDGLTVDGQPGGFAQVLVHGSAAFHPMLFTGTDHGFDDYYIHPEDEFVHVISGAILVDLDGALTAASAGDSLYYSGGVPHRWASSGSAGYRLLVVKARLSRSPEPPSC